MKILNLTIRPLMGLMAATGIINMAKATPLDSIEAGLALNNTIQDGDLGLLAVLVGAFPGQELDYGATITATGFTGFLSGLYAGQSLNVSYTGNSSAFPGGAVTWTSTGTYGASSWLGSGSATFSFPTATTFTETFTSSTAIGSNTGNDSAVINGTDDPNVTYTSSSGMLTVNDPTIECFEISRSYAENKNKTTDDYKASCFRFDPPPTTFVGFLVIQSQDTTQSLNLGIVDHGTMSFVPEPPSLIILGTGVLALAGILVGRSVGVSRVTQRRG
jgi:hypothetical protein